MAVQRTLPLTVAPAPRETLQHAVEEAARLLQANGAIIYLVDENGSDLRFAHSAGITHAPSREWLERLRLPAGEGLFGRAIADRTPLATGDYLADPRFTHSLEADRIAADIGLRSMVVAPLIAPDDEAIGALGTYSAEPDRFTEADVALVRALADHAATAIANGRLIEVIAASRASLARRAVAETSLRHIAAGITAIRDPAELLQQTVEEAARLLRADGAIIDLFDPATGRLHWAYDAGIEDAPERESLRRIQLAPGEGVFGKAFADLRVINSPDYLADERFPKGPAPTGFAAGFGIRSSMAAPLNGETGAVGAIGVWARRPNAWDEADEGTIRNLADVASVAMTNARLIERLARSERELARRVETERTLRAVAGRMTALTDLDDVLQPLVDDAKHLLRSDDAHLTLMDDTSRYLRPVVIAGTTDEAVRGWLQQMVFPLDGGINGLAASTNQAIWSEDYMVDPRVPHEEDDQLTAQRLGLRSIAVVPLRGPEGYVLGTLAVSFRRPGIVSPEAVELLQALGDHAAIAIANSRLYERLRSSEARYRYLVDSSPDIVFQTDAEGRFTYVSDVIERAAGWAPAELVGRHFALLIAPDDLPMLVGRFEATRADPTMKQHYRFTMLHRDGQRVPVELSGRGIAEDGVFVGTHGSVRDVGDQVRLEGDLRQQAVELAANQERAHLARELHDSVTQALFSMTLVTRSVELLIPRDPPSAIEKLGSLRELQRDALAEMRSLIFELRPGSLADDGLVRALRTHSAAVQGRIGLPIVLTADDVDRMSLDVEEALYRIAQEALHNVVKHAGARQVRLTLARNRNEVSLTVEDDGAGFDPGRTEAGHLGLAGMRARAEKIGGTLEVTSRKGEGTRVQVVVPVPAVDESVGPDGPDGAPDGSVAPDGGAAADPTAAVGA